MLIRKHDAAINEGEWREFLLAKDFGELVASGRNRDFPVIVPTHFVFDGMDEIFLHLARPNPVWSVLSENPAAVMSVSDAYAYIPTAVNGGDEDPKGYGVPTSYYAAVQALGRCTITDDPDEVAAILQAQLEHFQPEGGHEAVEAGKNPYGRLFPAIRGLRLHIEEVRAKFKFGNNKTVEHRLQIADWLESVHDVQAQKARAHQLRRLAANVTGSRR